MPSKGRLLAKLLVDSSGDVASGSLDNATIADGSITTEKLHTSVQNTLSSAILKTSSTGAATLPVGTTAQRPGSPTVGMTRFNTTTSSIEFYDGTIWTATNLIPSINSISGNIFAGAASTISINVSNNTDPITVRFVKNGITLADVSSVSVSSGVASVTIPSAVYSQNSGDSIVVSILNNDGTPSSNSISKTIISLPSGGTITTVGSYRVHTFTSSGTFTNTISGLAVDSLIVAGGGGGGYSEASATAGDGGGGGGAGGVIVATGTTLSAASYGVTVGAGGSGMSNGGNSGCYDLTAIGGGRGGSDAGTNDTAVDNFGVAGGSGGGAASPCESVTAPGGAGTSGQGYAGGDAYGCSNRHGAGGGGAGGVGSGGNNLGNGNGGVGIQNNFQTGSNQYYGGGGGGGAGSSTGNQGSGGTGGGAAGGGISANGSSGTSNTGGGGGGVGAGSSASGGNGGSGIVVIRYQL